MSVEYEMLSNEKFVMQVNLIDCNLDPAHKDEIFDYMKNEEMLLKYLKKVLPNARVKKIIKDPPKELTDNS
jgi:hypothetical protein